MLQPLIKLYPGLDLLNSVQDANGSVSPSLDALDTGVDSVHKDSEGHVIAAVGFG